MANLGLIMIKIFYKGGYKYQLNKPYTVEIFIKPEKAILTPYIDLSETGVLTIAAGYSWDGPSGPTFDTKSFMRPSLVHDALYQLMRQRHLVGGNLGHRKRADMLLRQHCLEDGMTKIRAWWVYRAVRVGSRQSSLAENKRPVLSAP